MALARDDVLKVAELARLRLTDQQVDLFARQLSDVLGYMQKLDELDTADVEPMTHPLPVTNVGRDDVPHDSLSTDDVLANAPDRRGGFFGVPPVLG